MLYVFENTANSMSPAIRLDASAIEMLQSTRDGDDDLVDYATSDIDFVDDQLLNTAPHNPIERQLLNGDVIGLAIMSSAILWSAMGAIA